MANKASLQYILQQVLSVANAEQNFAYPPTVFANHYNIVTSFLLDTLAKIYPSNLDPLLPFIVVKKIPVKSGYVILPDDYRTILGAPSISVKKDGRDCLCDDPVVIDTETEFKTAQRKAGCKTRPITIVDKSEWDYRTTSTYAFPTLDNPIGIFEGAKIKVCPYDLATVELMYIKKELIGVYGYIMQPDDTYINDPATTIEVGWEEDASQFLFKGCLSLYSAYAQSKELNDYVNVLKQIGLV